MAHAEIMEPFIPAAHVWLAETGFLLLFFFRILICIKLVTLVCCASRLSLNTTQHTKKDYMKHP